MRAILPHEILKSEVSETEKPETKSISLNYYTKLKIAQFWPKFYWQCVNDVWFVHLVHIRNVWFWNQAIRLEQAHMPIVKPQNEINEKHCLNLS
jgi:hypothetical protein